MTLHNKLAILHHRVVSCRGGIPIVIPQTSNQVCKDRSQLPTLDHHLLIDDFNKILAACRST